MKDITLHTADVTVEAHATPPKQQLRNTNCFFANAPTLLPSDYELMGFRGHNAHLDRTQSAEQRGLPVANSR